MTTITLKINDRKKSGKTFLELLEIFRAQGDAVEIVGEKEDDEDAYRATFEKEWAVGIPLEEARQQTLNHVRKLFDEKGSRKTRGSRVLK